MQRNQFRSDAENMQPLGTRRPASTNMLSMPKATSAGLQTQNLNKPKSAMSGAPTKPSESTPVFIEHKNSTGSVVKRYEKGHLLGKGGFAKCFLVTDCDSGQRKACKIVEKKSLTKNRHKVKLQSEIKIHKTMNHPHIVKIEEVFEDTDNVYLVMELCEYQTLLELVKRKRRLPDADVRRFMHQVVSACKYMHSNKVIHRDLKLGNMFLSSRYDMRIGDFGLACRVDFDGQRKRTLCGTPNYIAPEVLGQAGHSYEVDIWSVGVILYTMLVGKPPFETSDVKTTYKRIKANSYAFPERTNVNEQAKDLVRRLLHPCPEKRPGLDDILRHPYMREGAADLPPPAPHVDSHTVSSSTRAPLRTVQGSAEPLSRPKSTASTVASATTAAMEPMYRAESAQPSGKPVEQPATARPSTVASAAPVPSSTDKPGQLMGGSGCRAVPMTAAGTIGVVHKDMQIPKGLPSANPVSQFKESEEEDRAALASMLKYVENAENRPERVDGRKRSSLPLPNSWVSQWIDYSKKYGLGYQMNTGEIGVFFNDATKIICDMKAERMDYVERNKTALGGKQDERSSFACSAFPNKLNKKVTLLYHFTAFINEHKPGGDKADTSCASSAPHAAYVRKWMQTRHSIIFRLSNNAFQVCFFDGTEILLWPDQEYVTYVSKYGTRKTMTINAAWGSAEAAKRIRYCKEILNQLVVRG